jgi:hypothetical protein
MRKIPAQTRQAVWSGVFWITAAIPFLENINLKKDFRHHFPQPE